MLSVSTMALAAMLGSACVPNANQACNVNTCTYDQANCIQAECAANGGQDLNCLLRNIGKGRLLKIKSRRSFRFIAVFLSVVH